MGVAGGNGLLRWVVEDAEHLKLGRRHPPLILTASTICGMGLRIIDGVRKRSMVDLLRLGRVSEATVSAADGLAVNHDYQDLRELTLEDLNNVLEFETEALEELRLEDFSDAAVERIDEEWLESFLLPGIDFGVASAVVALSALVAFLSKLPGKDAR